jgi:hypothetical protein
VDPSAIELATIEFATIELHLRACPLAQRDRAAGTATVEPVLTDHIADFDPVTNWAAWTGGRARC